MNMYTDVNEYAVLLTPAGGAAIADPAEAADAHGNTKDARAERLDMAGVCAALLHDGCAASER